MLSNTDQMQKKKVKVLVDVKSRKKGMKTGCAGGEVKGGGVWK